MSPPAPAFLRLVFLALVLAAGGGQARADGDEVVVAYARGNADSRGVADYYALQRSVPERQVIALDVPAPGTSINRPDFDKRMQDALISELETRGLMRFEHRDVPASNGFPAHVEHRCVASKVRYLLLSWGLPYRINEDPKRIPPQYAKQAGQLVRNEASVDSELALLPAAGMYDLTGITPNPAFASTNPASYHPTNHVLLVTRLDGPTPALARGLVDKALFAEEHGLSGNAYIDLRNITSGGYKTGDDWITNAASACKRFGYPTFVDNRPETLPPTFPLSHVALYFGWYAGNADGPFARPEVEFMPGAIAYHLHSFSAMDPRSATANWVGPFVAKGATATMGCVAEPYLDFTPNPHIFFELLAVKRFTLGEAGIGCQRFLSWMNIVVGDPLYRPFKHHWFELEPGQIASHDTNLEWSILRRVNTHLVAGHDAGTLRQYLLEQPLATNSAVLAEKLAGMFADDGKLRHAAEWGRRAESLCRSLQQRTRIRLNLASWEEILDDHAAALATLRRIEDERPDYRDLLPFRRKQLSLAHDAGKKDEAARIQAEVKRLEAAEAAAAEAAAKPK